MPRPHDFSVGDELASPPASTPLSPADDNAGAYPARFERETVELPRRSSLAEGVAAIRQYSARGKTIALLALGGLIVAGMLYRVGAASVAALLGSLGWAAPVILVPYAIGAAFDVRGWSRVLVGSARRAVSFRRLYAIRMVGEAVNSLTPAAGLAGEPVKVYLLRRHGIRTAAGAASVVIAKSALVTAQIVFTLVGLVLLADFLGLLGDRALLLVAAWSAGIAIVALIIAGQRRGLAVRGARALRALGLNGALVGRLENRAAEIDTALAQFYREDPHGFLFATAYSMVGWLFGAGEVMLLLFLMGLACTWREALIIESITQAAMVSAAVVPGGFGVQEFSGAVLCRFLGIGEAAGLALMLLKRVRELAFSVIGLSLVLRLNGRAGPQDESK